MRIFLDEDFPASSTAPSGDGQCTCGRRRRRDAGHDILDLGRPLDADRPESCPAHGHATKGQPASRPSSSTFITVKVASVKPPSV